MSRVLDPFRFVLVAVAGGPVALDLHVDPPDPAARRALLSEGEFLAAFVIESLMLALVGGVIGIAASSLMQLATFSTVNFTSFSETVFRFELSGNVMLSSLRFAVLIGLIENGRPVLG